MSGYDFLRSLVIVEVAQLGMDSLGGYLADMGATVIKVEDPIEGDPVRFAGPDAVGEEGVGFLHLRWNRGKRSIGIDLSDPRGANIFRDLAAKADVVIEGLRAGGLDRLGLGYEVLRASNPDLVFCAVSGLGLTGTYHHMRSHAIAYDAYAGLLPKSLERAPKRHGEFTIPPIGMNAPGLYAAVGVLSALHRARECGKGAFIEVAAADAAANWVPDGMDAVVNRRACRSRAGFLDESGRMLHWPRLTHYRTRDGGYVLLQALRQATWEHFCGVIDRPDLLELSVENGGADSYHKALETALIEIFQERTLGDWMKLFIETGISGMPFNDLEDLSRDAHYLERANWYDADLQDGTALRLSGTPVRVRGQSFAPKLAPALGQHSDEILSCFTHLCDDDITALRAEGVLR